MRHIKKAVGALVAPVVTWAVVKLGLEADDEVVVTATALITSAVVYVLRNEY